jgi:heat shock protein HtpX
MGNGIKTTLLLGALSGLLLVIGELLGGANGLVFAFVLAAGMNFASYWFSDKIVLRMYRAQEVGPDHQLSRLVERLTRQANLPMPEVGIYESPELNAFATGPSKSRSLVAVSSGLLRSMTRNEVEGVLAHEVSHIANGDMVTMTLLQGIVNAFVMFLARIVAYALTNRGSRDDRGGAPSYMLVWLLEIVLGFIGMIVVAWFSRQREFRADYGGATLAGKADMLAALRRLGANRALIDPRHEALATMKISGKWTGLFSTHPPLEQRVAVLERAQIL